jgi:hypothetical protein
MRWFCSALILAGLAGGGVSAVAAEPRIDPAAEAWVFTSDLPPFSIERARGGSAGGAGLDYQYFGEHPENAGGDAEYRDRSRDMLVDISVVKNARTAFLDHLIEAQFRDATTARLHTEVSLIVMGGQPVFFYCGEPPGCGERTYTWRSGDRIVVKVEAKAFDRSPRTVPSSGHKPCPEPTEILQAYLQRYPSSLTLYTEDDEHAAKWRREQTALEIASAEFWLNQAGNAQPNQQSGLLDTARHHLESFAELREVAFRGPSASEEQKRLTAARQLPIPSRLTELNKIGQEYHAWWNTHQNDPVYLPPPK